MRGRDGGLMMATLFGWRSFPMPPIRAASPFFLMASIGLMLRGLAENDRWPQTDPAGFSR